MTPQEQFKFLAQLSIEVRTEILGMAMDGKLPPEWEEQELRQLLADAFRAETRPMMPARKTRYNKYLAKKLNMKSRQEPVRTKPPMK